MKKAKRKLASLTVWLAIESTTITVASVMTYALVDYFTEYILGGNAQYEPIRAIGMIVPMATIMGTTSYLFNKQFNRHVSGLTRGLQAVADGDFSVRLEVAAGGPLVQAYTDFNKMGKELRSIQTLREDFINNFSHEFKTPITAIRGFAELLLEPGITQEERQQYLQIISEESSRLADLANSTLLLSKLESQQSIPDKKTFALDEQLKRCAILLSASWEKKHISFSVELDEIRYTGNEELMRHVWLNLLSNAIKYTPEGGEVAVTLNMTATEIAVSIADTGIGMSEEVRTHMFDKYFQGDSSHTGKGLGLGLSIVYRIVELCGGRIEDTSVVNQGSTFTVYLPKFDSTTSCKH